MPEVSFVIPCYNASKHIDSFITALKSQSFEDWEAIFVDDHSTDDTFSKLGIFSEHDRRIIVLSEDVNSGGPYYPRLIGLDRCSSPYCCLLDVDDKINEVYLEAMLKRLKETGADIVFPDMVYRGQSITNIDMSEEYSGRELLKYTLYSWEVGCGGGLYNIDLLKNSYNIILPELCTKYLNPLIRAYPEIGQYMTYRNGIAFPKYIDEVGTRILLSESKRVAFCSEAKYDYIVTTDSITSNSTIRQIEFTLNDYVISKWIRDLNSSAAELGRAYKQQFCGVIEKIKWLLGNRKKISGDDWRKYDKLLRIMYTEINRNEVKPYLRKPLFLLTSAGYDWTKRLIRLHRS